MPEKPETAAALSLLSADAVRQRAHRLLAIGLEDGLAHFRIDLGRLGELPISSSRPRARPIPASRCRSTRAGGISCVGGEDRWAAIDDATPWGDAAERARAAFDLAITSVLLDAGAGPQWAYRDPDTGARVGRSGGPGAGEPRYVRARRILAAIARSPLRADAAALESLTGEALGRHFQVTEDNPLAGVDGRAALLRRLGAVVAAKPEIFARVDAPRPGGLFDHLAALAGNGAIPRPPSSPSCCATSGGIWPSRLELGGIPLGDCWRHPAMTTDDATSGLVPLHKLSQWLAYSLIEPLQAAGIEVTDIDGLTGLAEYRNGGLFIDTGVLALRDPGEAEREHDVGSALVVEWRALTVALLDRLADIVRRTTAQGCRLIAARPHPAGGTWAAGRAIARRRRADGSPPIKIVSDGTVF